MKTKKNVVKDEEVVNKKSVSKKADGKQAKTVEKTSAKKTAKAPGKFTPKEGRVFGKYSATSAKGKVAAQAAAKGKISEKEAKTLAKGKDAARILYRIRRFGKKSGMFSLFPSKKTDGLWIFKAVGKLPGVKLAKAA